MQVPNINATKIFFIANLCMTLAFVAMSPLVVRAERSYSFACNSVKNSKKVVPTTMMLFSNGTSKPLISWESNFVRKPKQQCEQVSQKFNDFSRLGNLHYLKFGTDRRTGKPIICGLSRINKDRSCEDSNKLFEMSKAIKDPREVLKGLRNSLVIPVTPGGIPQSDDDILVDLAASIDRSQLDQSK